MFTQIICTSALILIENRTKLGCVGVLVTSHCNSRCPALQLAARTRSKQQLRTKYGAKLVEGTSHNLRS